MSWQHQSQADHFISPKKLVTSNTYDWLQYRDEIERADKRLGQQRSHDEELPLQPYEYDLSRINSVFTTVSGNEDHLGVLSRTLFPHDTRYEIQYSVFKPVRTYSTLTNLNFEQVREESKRHFQYVVSDCIDAVSTYHIELARIKTGSSGSYFVYGTSSQSTPLGVFKPKEEEPYGPLSPKWTKWAHRTFFPCFFGRSCLIPNLGYICESAASLLDQRLQINIVPYTDTVVMESTSFYDKRKTWLFLCTMEPRKQRKLGSFQLFLKDYIGADEFLNKHPLPGMYRDEIPQIKNANKGSNATENTNSSEATATGGTGTSDADSNTKNNKAHEKFEWTEANLAKFRLELEKLIILDYIMRNTDRGLDNWMIKVVPRSGSVEAEWDIKLAAIDNGLAFPWKHPDEWRSYPYGWLYLPLQMLVQPFSEATRRHFLPILTSSQWWDESYKEFTNVFSRDSDFKLRMWKKQWAVLKGQAFNVVETLKDIRQGPLELVRRTRCLVVDEKMRVPIAYPSLSIMKTAINEPIPTQATSPMVLYSTSDSLHREEETSLNTAIPTASTDPSTLPDESEYHSATKTVIIERLQVVNSTPVFTWC